LKKKRNLWRSEAEPVEEVIETALGLRDGWASAASGLVES